MLMVTVSVKLLRYMTVKKGATFRIENNSISLDFAAFAAFGDLSAICVCPRIRGNMLKRSWVLIQNVMVACYRLSEATVDAYLSQRYDRAGTGHVSLNEQAT